MPSNRAIKSAALAKARELLSGAPLLYISPRGDRAVPYHRVPAGSPLISVGWEDCDGNFHEFVQDFGTRPR